MVRVESVRFVGEINITLGYCRNKTFGFNQICECMDSIIILENRMFVFVIKLIRF